MSTALERAKAQYEAQGLVEQAEFDRAQTFRLDFAVPAYGVTRIEITGTAPFRVIETCTVGGRLGWFVEGVEAPYVRSRRGNHPKAFDAQGRAEPTGIPLLSFPQASDLAARLNAAAGQLKVAA